jgi:hypothetical protein
METGCTFVPMAKIVKWLISHFRMAARALAWIGILAIIILSVVPAADRPVSGAGQLFEHFAAFGLITAVIAIGYDLPLIRLLFFAFLFCGGIELLQVLVPTRHARVSDFFIDFVASCFVIAVIFAVDKLIGGRRRNSCSRPK